jgi:hypothetical protein
MRSPFTIFQNKPARGSQSAITLAPKVKAEKGLIGRLFEKTGSWIKPSGRARINAKDLQGHKDWETAQNIDLSEQQSLPQNFKAPIAVERIRFNYDADQEGGIATNPTLLKSLPTQTPVKAEFTISTRQIFHLLQNEPEKLTPEMARVIIGNKEEIQGLSDKALFKTLHRLERKLDTAQLDQIDVEVKNLLLAKLEHSTDKNIWKQALKLKEFLRESKYEAIATEATKPTASKAGTQKALEKELTLLKDAISRPSELGEIAAFAKLDEAKIAKQILEQNLNFIKTRSKQGSSYNKQDLINQHIHKQYAHLFKSIKDESIRNALIKIAYSSLQRLETRFEATGTQKAKDYARLTVLNNGSNERLLYATAMMERDSGIIQSSKKYDIQKLAN